MIRIYILAILSALFTAVALNSEPVNIGVAIVNAKFFEPFAWVSGVLCFIETARALLTSIG